MRRAIVKHRVVPFACAAALLVMVLGWQRASAATISVDENGNGTLDLTAEGGAVTPMPGVLAPDPGPGGLPAVLTYNLLGPPSLVAGDVLLQEGVGGPIFDVLRFNPAGTGGNPAYPASLLFYSDNTDGFDAIADTTGPPAALYANVRTILEVGPEGANGAVYTPGPGDPGFVAGFAVTYNFISDGTLAAVPSPAVAGSALSLLGPLAGLNFWSRRRRAA